MESAGAYYRRTTSNESPFLDHALSSESPVMMPDTFTTTTTNGNNPALELDMDDDEYPIVSHARRMLHEALRIKATSPRPGHTPSPGPGSGSRATSPRFNATTIGNTFGHTNNPLTGSTTSFQRLSSTLSASTTSTVFPTSISSSSFFPHDHPSSSSSSSSSAQPMTDYDQSNPPHNLPLAAGLMGMLRRPSTSSNSSGHSNNSTFHNNYYSNGNSDRGNFSSNNSGYNSIQTSPDRHNTTSFQSMSIMPSMQVSVCLFMIN